MMTKSAAVLLTACVLLLAACAGLAASEPAPLAELEAQAAYERPVYEAVPLTLSDVIYSEDGKQEPLARYSYQIITLSVRNQEAVSPEDEAIAARNKEVFDAKMLAAADALMEQGGEMAADAAAVYGEYGALTETYEDSAAVDAVFCGDIVSACLRRRSWTGGAHPNSYTDSYLFDLAAGQFIDPTQIAENPEAFRTGASELLLEKAEASADREMFWEDYADVIARWNEGTVDFGNEGMRVTYSPYELGPYAIGEVELLLSWEELAPLVGEGGMERLGKETGG